MAAIIKPGAARDAKAARRKRPPQERINDIVPAEWRSYSDILTDSLWIIDKRDRSGAHSNMLWGNFIPQIPHQVMRRYTRRNDIVLDMFAGSGTSIIEASRLGRHSIGMDLNEEMVTYVNSLISAGLDNPYDVTATIVQGDSTDVDASLRKLRCAMKPLGKQRAQLVFLHPPYHDIIRFSAAPADLSNCGGVAEFVDRFSRSVELSAQLLDQGRYLCLVIGDCYKRQEWIPLGFMTMQAVLNTGRFRLKSIIVKNMNGSRGKQKQNNLWRYRSLKHNTVVFAHEYLFLFQRRKG